MLLAENKLYTIKVLIYEALFDLYINHDEFVSVNNVLREYNEMKEAIKNPENTVEYTIQKQRKRIASVVRKIIRTKIQVSEEISKIYWQLLVLPSKPHNLLAILICVLCYNTYTRKQLFKSKFVLKKHLFTEVL